MKSILTVALLALSSFALAQSKVELQLQLLTPDLIGDVTLDKDPFMQWIKEVTDAVEADLTQEKGDKDVLILISVHRDKDATFQIGARPKLAGASQERLLRKLTALKSPRTKVTDYSLIVAAKVNKGGNKDKEFTPTLMTPEAHDLEEFEKLPLAEKKEALQLWITTDIIPIISHYEVIVDPKFAGVLSVGKMLEQKTFQSTSVDQLTDRNANYWRATMEMEIGNQLIPFTKVCMYFATGEFDKGKRLLAITNYTSEKSTGPAILSTGISKRVQLLDEALNSEIQKGIALHDKGKYADVIAHYESLLKVFPNSAWLNYELYYSRAAQLKNDNQKVMLWTTTKPRIFACDPMYHMNVHASSGKEGYLLFRQQEINELFKTKDNFKTDFVRYADIALDLENYGFAAQLYWIIFTQLSEKEYGKRNMLAHYLYCLDKLGDKENIKNFKGDFPGEFEKIRKEREKLMKESPLYDAFEKKE